MEFNHADLFEAVADVVGERVAAVCGDRRLTYAELDAEANRLAHHLTEAGVRPGQHVGMQMYNCLEYVTAILATLKIRAVPVNVNYRFVEDELRYLYTDSDMVALVYDVEFDARVAATAPQAPKLGHLIGVGGPTAVPGAVTYAQAVEGQSAERDFPARSGDDIYIIYTGGTTGFPKGVMWRVEDLFFAYRGGNPYGEPHKTPEQVPAFAKDFGSVRMFLVPPLMHGAAQVATFIGWWLGATLVYARRFDAATVLETAEREQVNALSITGDAMARPLIAALEQRQYDLSSLVTLSSTSAILTGSVRDRLQELLPHAMILDNFGSTESGYTAEAVAGSSPESGLRYMPGTAGVAVLDDDGSPVEPGSGVVGQVAKSGPIALGYYKDEEKTARSFVVVDGVRWLLTGDRATVEPDGTITVFGRGSQSINTGGEKVFPEEVEAVLKGHPGVFDAVVTSVPDERFGNKVTAVVQPYADRARPEEEDLDRHCRASLAGYKVPRLYVFTDEIKRSPAGKADYPWAKALAARAVS